MGPHYPTTKRLLQANPQARSTHKLRRPNANSSRSGKAASALSPARHQAGGSAQNQGEAQAFESDSARDSTQRANNQSRSDNRFRKTMISALFS